ncbi:lamin tail domain-containing protein [Streptomyces sp. NRRL F-5123]|uniref:lamin tail domain-containing protein n=1 Tax=Streptomyces sp. NRRL F-5123 TaxID=1463856 RepID=UPI001F17F97A|nr:lamin tail domain-containing protein [Streptomyces sp. NRRL F-5123]
MSRIASRLAATVLAAGALLTVAALPASAAPAEHGRHGQHEQHGQHDQPDQHGQRQQHGQHDQPDQHGQRQQRDQPDQHGQSDQHGQRDQHGRHQQMGAQVALGSVHHTRDARSARGLNDEWITVTNEGRRAVSLDRWTLSDADHHVYRFGHVTLRAHESLRVHSGRGRDTYRDLYQGGNRSMWDRGGDSATLRDARGHVVDTESWGRSHR